MIERVFGLISADTFMPQEKMKTTLVSEIENCFRYFEGSVPNFNGSCVLSIHGKGITLSRSDDKKGYTLEISVLNDPKIVSPHRDLIKIHDGKVSKSRVRFSDGSKMPIEQKVIENDEFNAIINSIRNITLNYSEHIKNRK